MMHSDIILEMRYINVKDSKINVLIPKEFEPMPEKYAKLKYPLENRPNVIMTNSEMNVDFKFELLNLMADEDMLELLASMLKNKLAKFNSGYQFYEQKSEQTAKGKKVVWFDFMNPAIDGDIYNFMFYSYMDNKILQGAINCPYATREFWKPFMHHCMKSIYEED